MDILFDIGNVIVHVDFIPALKRLIPAGTKNPDQLLSTLLARKNESEAGRIPPSEYFPWAARTLGFNGPLETFQQAWVDIFSPNLPMCQCIEKLHQQGHRLILFSNTNKLHWDYLYGQYRVFQCFTGGILSYQTGHIKPEPEIYQLAIRQYHLTPENTLYIDDLPANIQGGQNAGFICHTYRANRHQDFLHWLTGAMKCPPQRLAKA